MMSLEVTPLKHDEVQHGPQIDLCMYFFASKLCSCNPSAKFYMYITSWNEQCVKFTMTIHYDRRSLQMQMSATVNGYLSLGKTLSPVFHLAGNQMPLE